MSMEVRRTRVFSDWLDRLRDEIARARIAARLRRVAVGLVGDAKSVGDGVHVLRIDYGPGYRVYYVHAGQAMIVLLCGGDKGSQARDIARAKSLAKEL